MEEITTAGIALAKTKFQIHAVDAAGRVIVQKALKRRDLVTFFSRLRARRTLAPALTIAGS